MLQIAEVRKAGSIVETSLDGVAKVCTASKLDAIMENPSHLSTRI